MLYPCGAVAQRVSLEQIPASDWDIPSVVISTDMEQAMVNMESRGIQYASKVSYHQMCRWYSGFFYKHSALKDMRYYWRVEPNIKYVLFLVFPSSHQTFCTALCLLNAGGVSYLTFA